MSRIEEDIFGIVKLPDHALYGIQTQRCVENLSFSGRQLHAYPEYLVALADVKQAAAKANMLAGVLTQNITQAIELACKEIKDGYHHEQFIVDPYHGGGSIGSNMNMNEVVANLANEIIGGSFLDNKLIHPNEHVNASQSTADACHTALRIAVIRCGMKLHMECNQLIEALHNKSDQWMSVSTITRTCLQDGMSDTLGKMLLGYVHGLSRRVNSLHNRVLALHAVNLGGTVIGSSLGAPHYYREHILAKLNEVTGITLYHRENLYDAAQNMDDLAAVSAELQLLASLLIKISKDLRILSSGPEAGFGEIKLPAVQAGSSFFPGKINPVVPETLIQCCFQIIGLDRAVQASLEHGELNLNVWEGAAGFNVLDMMNMLRRAIVLFTNKCVIGLEADVEKCTTLSKTFIPIVVELKERYGYREVEQWLRNHSREEIMEKYEGKVD